MKPSKTENYVLWLLAFPFFFFFVFVCLFGFTWLVIVFVHVLTKQDYKNCFEGVSAFLLVITCSTVSFFDCTADFVFQ